VANAGSKNPNLWALIVLFFAVLGSIAAGKTIVAKWLDFNLDREFDGAKAYFQTSGEESKLTPPQVQYFKSLANFQLLNDAADYFDISETNQIRSGQLREIIHCYEEFYTVTPQVYSDMEDHNNWIANMATMALVIFVVAAWASWMAGFYCCANMPADGKGLSKSAAQVKTSVDKIARGGKRKRSG